MKRYLLGAAAAALVAVNASAWSQKGHDVTAAIAERHLTDATAQAVDSILQGRSMVYWANWMDNASHNYPYDYTKTWHCRNVDSSGDYYKSAPNPSGDVITALTGQSALLSSGSATPEESALAMKIIVHLMGDMHQPLHMGRLDDLGGNRVKVKFFKRDTNLHSVWDSNIVETGHKWSYTEWADQIDRDVAGVDTAAIVAGTLDEWGEETWHIAERVYEATPSGTDISYNYVAYWTPVAETQLLRAGLRLAHLLNTIFDADYAATHTSPLAQ